MEHHTLRAQLVPEKQFHESEFIGNETDIKKLGKHSASEAV